MQEQFISIYTNGEHLLCFSGSKRWIPPCPWQETWIQMQAPIYHFLLLYLTAPRQRKHRDTLALSLPSSPPHICMHYRRRYRLALWLIQTMKQNRRLGRREREGMARLPHNTSGRPEIIPLPFLIEWPWTSSYLLAWSTVQGSCKDENRETFILQEQNKKVSNSVCAYINYI